MATPTSAIDWDAVIADPRFQSLHRKKQRFLTGLMVFSVAFYFLLPIGAAYFQDLFRVKVWGVVNVGLAVRAQRIHRRLADRVLLLAAGGCRVRSVGTGNRGGLRTQGKVPA